MKSSSNKKVPARTQVINGMPFRFEGNSTWAVISVFGHTLLIVSDGAWEIIGDISDDLGAQLVDAFGPLA